MSKAKEIQKQNVMIIHCLTWPLEVPPTIK
jgi:hypothetical protein